MIERVRLGYHDPRPRSDIGKVRTALMYLLDGHNRDGALPTSVRFLFYELVAQRIISKSGKRPDKIVSAALTDLRERGKIPWDWIVDEPREVFDFTGSASVVENWLLYLGSACLDPWLGQVPFILTESRSLAGVLRAMCSNYRVRIASTNGQVGGFLHTKLGPLLGADDTVGYLGDFDLAGGHIEANTRRVLEEIVGGELKWTRLALTREQVDEYDLPVIIKYDNRYKAAAVVTKRWRAKRCRRPSSWTSCATGLRRCCRSRSNAYLSVNAANVNGCASRLPSNGELQMRKDDDGGIIDDEYYREDRQPQRKRFADPGSMPKACYSEQDLLDAVSWLRKLLSDGDLYERDVKVQAEDCRVPLSLLTKAKKRMGIISYNVNDKSPHALWKLWFWKLPPKRGLL
jgi:hypothetical protein